MMASNMLFVWVASGSEARARGTARSGPTGYVTGNRFSDLLQTDGSDLPVPAPLACPAERRVRRMAFVRG